jgi:hypothetical protein
MPLAPQSGLARTRLGFAILCLFAFALLFPASNAFGQQTYVPRFNTYIGYSFLDSPHVGLFENGLHYQAGVNPTTWLAVGFDYSFSEGNLTLTPNLLTTALQQQLGAELTALGYPVSSLAVPSHSSTQTFAGGPQFEYRHFSKVTLFVRPSFGVIKEIATPHPVGEVPSLVVATLLNGKFSTTDTTPFYGFGGGADWNFSQHVALRVQADLVYDHLFSNLLKDGRLTTRFSIGPCFNFGSNIRKAGSL